MFIKVNFSDNKYAYINVAHIITVFPNDTGTTLSLASAPNSTTINCIDDCDTVLDRIEKCYKK